MKVKDLFAFNPDAELGFMDNDNVFKLLEIYGYIQDDTSRLAVAIQPQEDISIEEKEEIDVANIPKSIDDAISNLNEELNDYSKKWIFEHGAPPQHFFLGRWIRNNWGLWEEEPNELKKELIALGYYHPDDMSNYIIKRFIEKYKDS